MNYIQMLFTNDLTLGLYVLRPEARSGIHRAEITVQQNVLSAEALGKILFIISMFYFIF